MKRILWFTSGVIAGVIAVLYYEIFGKPVLPNPEPQSQTTKLERLRGRIACLDCGSKMVGWISSKDKWYCWDCNNYMTSEELYEANELSQNPEIVNHGVNFKYVHFDELMPEYDGWADVFEDEPDEYLNAPDKTQPIKVED